MDNFIKTPPSSEEREESERKSLYRYLHIWGILICTPGPYMDWAATDVLEIHRKKAKQQEEVHGQGPFTVGRLRMQLQEKKNNRWSWKVKAT